MFFAFFFNSSFFFSNSGGIIKQSIVKEDGTIVVSLNASSCNLLIHSDVFSGPYFSTKSLIIEFIFFFVTGSSING